MISEKFDLSANEFLTWCGVIQSISTEWKNIFRNANFSIESYSQEAMINYRHGIFIGNNFYGITRVKTSMIYNALVQKSLYPQHPETNFLKSLISVRRTGQKSILLQEKVA